MSTTARSLVLTRGISAVGLSALASLTLFPFLWVLLLSTHDRETIFSGTLPFYWGDQLAENYVRLLEILPFWRVLWNSVSVSLLSTLVSLAICSLGGYAFAVYRFPGKTALFAMLIISMMIPPVLSLIPYYLVVSFIGLLDTHAAIWLPLAITPFGVFLVRQYVASSVPRDLFDAARIEGANEFQLFWHVALPLVKPALATLAIVQFVGAWNNFMIPLIVLKSQDMYVLTLALRSVQSVANTPWGAVMLGTFLSMLPLLIVFAFASRQIMAGLTSGAVK